jgi:putative transport protein
MGVTVSRIRPADQPEVRLAAGGTVLKKGDRIVAVGAGAMLDQFEWVVGRRTDEDLLQAPGSVTSLRVVVTSKRVLGKSVSELGLDHLFGVVITRITRADLEMSAVQDLRLRFGDVLQVVGDEASVQKAAVFLGNSLKELNETHFIPLFIGIAFGIALGTLPVAVPGLPQPLRLGLAGGALIVALVLGRLGGLDGWSCTCQPM